MVTKGAIVITHFPLLLVVFQAPCFRFYLRPAEGLKGHCNHTLSRRRRRRRRKRKRRRRRRKRRRRRRRRRMRRRRRSSNLHPLVIQLPGGPEVTVGGKSVMLADFVQSCAPDATPVAIQLQNPDFFTFTLSY